MRSSHVAWIGAVLTFAIVLAVGLSRSEPPDSHAAAAASAADAAQALPGNRRQAPPAPEAADAGEPLAVVTAEAPEDGRAMMEAAAADADPVVREEAAALERALAAESNPAD